MVLPKSVLIGKETLILIFFVVGSVMTAFLVLGICFKLVIINSIFDSMKIN